VKIALAIFVKTPGLSEVKTRLAASIGKNRAEEFYFYSLKAIESVAIDLKRLNPLVEPIWALAEVNAHLNPLWQSFDKIYQGEGGLGERLASVHDQLFKKFDIVYFIGADSPHISASFLSQSMSAFVETNADFQIGDALDGGFYFLGMKKRIPPSVWTNVSYSTDTTSAELKEKISLIGSTDEVEKNFDVDTVEDLLKYKTHEFEILNPTKKQVELIKWIKENF
jgi:glycosyltransferase A (GT-A) superfamily protein (DUF2064 family)